MCLVELKICAIQFETRTLIRNSQVRLSPSRVVHHVVHSFSALTIAL